MRMHSYLHICHLKIIFSYCDHKAEFEDSPTSCDITTGYILKVVLYFIGLECYEPDGPEGGTKQCNEFGGSKFCTVTCHSGSQLYRETASYWQCNKGVWTPSDVIPDCVGKTNHIIVLFIDKTKCSLD